MVGFHSPQAPAGQSTATLAGQVINAVSGQSIARALVAIEGQAKLTDHEGRFSFAGVGSTTTVMVGATRPGFSQSPDQTEGGEQNVTIPQDGRPVPVRMFPLALLTGTVTGPDGQPLVRIPIVALRHTPALYGASTWSPGGQTSTDSHGRFRLQVPAGTYVLRSSFVARAFRGTEAALPETLPHLSSEGEGGAPFHLACGDEVHVDFHPPVAPLFFVTMKMAGLLASQMPRLSAEDGAGGDLPVNNVRRTETGDLVFVLPSGTYTLRGTVFGTGGSLFASALVTVPDRDVNLGSLQFNPTPSFPVEVSQESGSSSADGAPPKPEQLGLSLKPSSSRPVFSPGAAGPNQRSGTLLALPGSYRLRVNPFGAWNVVSATVGGTDLLTHDLVVDAAAGSSPVRIVVSRQGGSLKGTVRLNGVAGECWVYLIHVDPSLAPVRSIRSRADGSFTVTSVPPGTYRVLATEFESRVDLSDASVLAAFGTRMQTLSVQQGVPSTVEIDAIPWKNGGT